MEHYEVIAADSIQISQWSGGVTRELAIFPFGSSYADRTFMVRLSSADINQEISVFTDLPGYTRLIMAITDGEPDHLREIYYWLYDEAVKHGFLPQCNVNMGCYSYKRGVGSSQQFKYSIC